MSDLYSILLELLRLSKLKADNIEWMTAIPVNETQKPLSSRVNVLTKRVRKTEWKTETDIYKKE